MIATNRIIKRSFAMCERCQWCGCVAESESRWYWNKDRVCEDCYYAIVEGEVEKWHLFRLQISLAVAAVMVAIVAWVVWVVVG